MSERNVWFITRPERDPRYHADAVKALAEATNNFTTIWQGNREAHKEFERVLAARNLKRNNISNDGSGGRTWCAMLKTFAYCYIDHEGYVKPTKVGEALLNGVKEYANVKKQILTLQIPNAYFLEPGFKPKFASSFRIRPARFLIKLVQRAELDHCVTKEEITYFVLTAQNDEQLDLIISKILAFRDADEATQQAMRLDIAINYDHRARTDKAARDYFQAHSDVAHTFMLLCEYTGLVEYVRGEAVLKIDADLVDEANETLQYYDERYPFNTRYLISSERMAQNNGLDVDSYKASSFGDIAPANNQEKFKNKVKEEYNKIPNPSELSRDELMEHFLPVFGPRDSKTIVDNIIKANKKMTSVLPEFVETYLGEMSPKDFELETKKILEAIGFNVVYEPKTENNGTTIELFVSYGEYAGIIDTKYYPNGFGLTQNLANYMGSEYIKNYLNYGDVPLSFYGYITSSKYTGEKKLQSITKLAEDLTGHHIEGFLLQRDVLLGFLDYCLENELPVQERINLFISAINNKGIQHF